MVIFYVAIGLTGLMIVPMLPDLAANLLITLAPGQTLKLAPKSFVYAFTSPASVGFIFDRLRNCRPDPVPPPSSFIKPHARHLAPALQSHALQALVQFVRHSFHEARHDCIGALRANASFAPRVTALHPRFPCPLCFKSSSFTSMRKCPPPT